MAKALLGLWSVCFPAGMNVFVSRGLLGGVLAARCLVWWLQLVSPDMGVLLQ